MNLVWSRLRQATPAALYSYSALMTRLALALLGLTLVAVPPASAETFTLDQTFNDPTVTTFDRFGWSVAIDGNNVLIGAVLDDTNGSSVGQAHLFDTSGTLLPTFNDPTVTGGDGFGNSVAIDGNNVLIGASGDDTNGIQVGQAYLGTFPKRCHLR